MDEFLIIYVILKRLRDNLLSNNDSDEHNDNFDNVTMGIDIRDILDLLEMEKLMVSLGDFYDLENSMITIKGLEYLKNNEEMVRCKPFDETMTHNRVLNIEPPKKPPEKKSHIFKEAKLCQLDY